MRRARQAISTPATRRERLFRRKPSRRRSRARSPEAARDDGREPEIGERDSFEEIDYGTTFEEYLDPGYRTRETEVKETPSFEQFLRSEDSLADYLNWQLRLTITAPKWPPPPKRSSATSTTTATSTARSKR